MMKRRSNGCKRNLDFFFEMGYLGDASLYHLTNNQEYRLVVRFLFYTKNTLFNISFAINITSWFMKEHRESHMATNKRVFMNCCKGTKDHGLFYPYDKRSMLTTCTNIDWAKDWNLKKWILMLWHFALGILLKFENCSMD
jgi:hypothetical protein